MKRYRKLIEALALTCLMLATSYAIGLASTLTPPYVIAIQDTGANTHPSRVGVDPERGLAYVLDQQGAIWVFAGVEMTATLPGGSPNYVAVDPGRYAYVTQRDGGAVRVLKGKNLQGTVSLGGKLSGAAVVLTPTHDVYVALPAVNQVAVFQVAVFRDAVPVTYVTVGTTPFALAADPTNERIYVANQGSANVSVLQGTTVITTIPVGQSPAAVAVNPVKDYVYVANSGDDTVSIIHDLAVVQTVAVGHVPGDIAVNPVNGRVYVVNNGAPGHSGSLSVLQDAQATPVATALEGNDLRAVDVNPRSSYIYVIGGRGGGGTVAVLSDTLVIETFLPVGHSPADVAVDPVSDLGYASLYKAMGGEMGQVVVLGRSEASVAPIDPATGGTLACDGVNDRPIQIEVPPNAVTETVTLLCAAWEPNTLPAYHFAGQGFLLKVYKFGIHRPAYQFQTPITVRAAYPTPLPGNADVAKLELRIGASGEGVWGTTGIVSQEVQTALSQMVATILKLPERSQDGYALVTPAGKIYLPLVLKATY